MARACRSEEPDQSQDGDDERRDHEGSVNPRAPPSMAPKRQAAHGQHAVTWPIQSNGAGRPPGLRGAGQQRQGEDPDRHVQDEDPSPVDGGQGATQDRAGGGRDRAAHRPDPDGPGPGPGAGKVCPSSAIEDGVTTAAKSLQERGGDQRGQVRGGAAQDGGDDEPGDAEGEGVAGADPVRERPAG